MDTPLAIAEPSATTNAPSAQPTIREIKRVVCARKGITLAEMDSPCRKYRFSRPRQVAMYLSRKLTDKSYPALGRMFGGRDHTTVLFAYRKIVRVMDRNPDLEIALLRYEEEITEVVRARVPGLMALPVITRIATRGPPIIHIRAASLRVSAEMMGVV